MNKNKSIAIADVTFTLKGPIAVIIFLETLL